LHRIKRQAARENKSNRFDIARTSPAPDPPTSFSRKKKITNRIKPKGHDETINGANRLTI
jgi:hypothetical protein